MRSETNVRYTRFQHLLQMIGLAARYSVTKYEYEQHGRVFAP